jgi:hypothetical protein
MFDFLFESKGFLRTVGSTLAAVGEIMTVIPEPQFQVIGALLLKTGAIIGGLGVVRAAAVKVSSK